MPFYSDWHNLRKRHNHCSCAIVEPNDNKVLSYAKFCKSKWLIATRHSSGVHCPLIDRSSHNQDASSSFARFNVNQSFVVWIGVAISISIFQLVLLPIRWFLPNFQKMYYIYKIITHLRKLLSLKQNNVSEKYEKKAATESGNYSNI